MIFIPTPIDGLFEVELEKRQDDRGFFARVFCSDEMRLSGLVNNVVQVNTSFSKSKGTLRGLHYQAAPNGESKLIRCLNGEIFDVALDLRDGSPTFGRWFGTQLSAKTGKMLYIPKGFAHGFLTLKDRTEIMYFVSNRYSATSERIIRWNDPIFKFEWPMEPQILSAKDQFAPDFNEITHRSGYR